MKNLIAAACCSLFATFAAAQYPDKPIKLVVPFPSGSMTDVVARQLADEMSKDLKQPVVIDNKGGASGIIGTQSGVNAPADGYTLFMVGVTTGASNVAMFRKLPYDPVKDFSPIGLIAESPLILVARPKLNVKDTRDLLRQGKANPGKLSYSFGSGSSQVASAKFVAMGGIDVLPVPYKGSPQALTDVMGGLIDFMMIDLAIAIPQIQAGKVKALGVTTRERFPLVPEIPTLHEGGVPGYELKIWFGMAAPANLSPEITKRVSAALNKALASEETNKRFSSWGLAPRTSTPEEFGAMVKQEVETWGALVKAANIPPQDL
jgi:tripartite-type tricarboxylate transporter receptor subunit TctC